MTALNQIQKEIIATLRKNNERPIINVEQGLGKTREKATSEVVRKSDSTVVFEGTGQECADYIFKHKGADISFRTKFRTQ